MRSPANSNGTTIPCSWFASFPVLCWVHIACPPPGLVFLVLPSPTKDKLFSQFSPSFTLKDGEPKLFLACNALHQLIQSMYLRDVVETSTQFYLTNLFD